MPPDLLGGGVARPAAAAPPGGAPAWLVSLGAALALPAFLFVVLRPDLLGLVPNSLDPQFYTGYAFNLDDILAAVRDRHYFVTRWSVYLPMHALSAWLPPGASRLVWRWLLAAAVLLSLWSFGAQWAWSWRERLLAGVLVLTLPMFGRAFMTDYVEHLVVAVGLCLVFLALDRRVSARRFVLLGALAALMLVANPVAGTAAAPPLLAALALGPQGSGARVRAVLLAAAALVATLAAGLLLFRWRYGIEDVYRPTVEFLRTYRSVDPLRSPRLEWLVDYTWIWAPAVLLAAAAFVGRLPGVCFDRVERWVLGVCAGQYAYQWFDQFVRGGDGLEISYYWSYMYPALAAGLIVVVLRLASPVRGWRLAAWVAGWLLLLRFGWPAPRLPGSWLLAPTLLAVLGFIVLAARRSRAAAGALLALAVLATQVAAPPHDVSAYHFKNTSPRYDRVYGRAHYESADVWSETLWFAEEMDRVAGDATATFVPTDPKAGIVVAIYGPQVSDRLLRAQTTGLLPPEALVDMRGGERHLLALLGRPARVAGVLAQIGGLGLGPTTVERDVTHRGGLGYRLAVVRVPGIEAPSFTWPADLLLTQVGRRIGTTLAAGEGDGQGVLSYGPYAHLAPGRYRAVLRYHSTAPPTSFPGTFDVVADGVHPVAAREIPGSAGEPREVFLTFRVAGPGGRWEFRSHWRGPGDLVVESVTLQRRGPGAKRRRPR